MDDSMLSEEMVAQLKAATPIAWALLNGFVTENQKPLEFERHRFLIDIMADMHPDIVWMKSAQVGLSVASIIKVIWLAKYMKMNVIYVLPTNNVVKDFVIPKVDSLISSNPAISDIVSKDSVSLKQVGDRFIYYRGAFSEREAISLSADALIIDELDRCTDLKVLQTYDSRLQASDWGWRWRFSNPSIPGFGVHELYEKSTQHHWFVRCHHCRHRSFMHYEEDQYYHSHYVNEELSIYACGKCHKELSIDDRINGEWIAKYRARARKGYWINQMMAPWVPASYIIEKRYENNPAFFYNFVLGLPYQASDMMLDRQVILNACAPILIEYDDMVMGTDVGLKKHYVLGNANGVVRYGDSMDWESLEAIFLANNCRAWVIDANPDQTIPRKLAKKYPGRVFINFYIQDKKNMGIIRWLDGDHKGVVHADRTKIIDHVVMEIQNKDIKFRINPHDMDEFIYHATNTYRVTEDDGFGMSKSKWAVKEGKPDHLLHALIYWRIALTKVMQGSGMIITPNAPGKTKSGFITNPYTNKMEGFHIDLGKIVKESTKKSKDWFYK
jgi:DNA-directed RNA polymerase subunit RPC12/RpoP